MRERWHDPAGRKELIMKAILIGATGAVGRDLLDLLLKDDRYDRVVTFTRREVGRDDAKLTAHVVDFEKPEGWHDLVKGDVLFSALGTSKKQAGSKQAQYHVDHDYQMMFARFARENGVPRLVLVSSVGADPASRFFYLRLKGEIEQELAAMGFESLTILQPPSLIRQHAKRPLETISVRALMGLNALGLAKSMAPMRTSIVAACMADAGADEHFRGVRRITGQDIRKPLA